MSMYRLIGKKKSLLYHPTYTRAEILFSWPTEEIMAGKNKYF
jgi:hypothetical protein